MCFFCGVFTGCEKPAVDQPQNGSSGISNSTKAENENIKPAQLSEQDIRNLIRFWENAQDAGDFEGYRSCYMKAFKGVKTTASKSNEYDYREWMDDRRKMLIKAVGLDVEIKRMEISIDGETATVEFDQYYYSKNYSDWGPKVLKIKQTPDGPKIYYEMLKASYPL